MVAIFCHDKPHKHLSLHTRFHVESTMTTLTLITQCQGGGKQCRIDSKRKLQ